jgi:hypothetical protein
LHEVIDLEGIGQEGWATLIWLKIGAVVETTCVNILLVIYLVQIQASRAFFILTLSI